MRRFIVRHTQQHNTTTTTITEEDDDFPTMMMRSRRRVGNDDDDDGRRELVVVKNDVFCSSSRCSRARRAIVLHHHHRPRRCPGDYPHHQTEFRRGRNAVSSRMAVHVASDRTENEQPKTIFAVERHARVDGDGEATHLPFNIFNGR